MNKPPSLLAENLCKGYWQGGLNVSVLQGVDLHVRQGESVAITGASGCGKSTLLHLLAGLDVPDHGKVAIDGVDICQLSERARGRLRNRCMGFIYQFHHLLLEFTAQENVMMPLLIGGVAKREAAQRAQEWLVKMGLGERIQHRPGELSGGERQRVAIARALIPEPQWVLADEPTGNLDEKTAGEVYELMMEWKQALGIGLILVTHNHALLDRIDVCYRLHQGALAIMDVDRLSQGEGDSLGTT